MARLDACLDLADGTRMSGRMFDGQWSPGLLLRGRLDLPGRRGGDGWPEPGITRPVEKMSRFGKPTVARVNGLPGGGLGSCFPAISHRPSDVSFWTRRLMWGSFP